jgi:ATP/ADP translocase
MAFAVIGGISVSFRQHSFPSGSILSAVCLGILGVICVCTSVGLTDGKTWAWAALVGTVITLLTGVSLACSAFYSHDAYIRSEGGFVFIVGISLAVPASISALLLPLPRVRYSFFHRPVADRNLESH